MLESSQGVLLLLPLSLPLLLLLPPLFPFPLLLLPGARRSQLPMLKAGPVSIWVCPAPPFLLRPSRTRGLHPPCWPRPQLHSVPVSALGFGFHFN